MLKYDQQKLELTHVMLSLYITEVFVKGSFLFTKVIKK